MTIMQQVGRVSASLENATRARSFVCVAKSLLAGGNEVGAAEQWAKGFGFSDEVVRIVKGGVASGVTSTATWAAELAAFRLIAQGFLQTIRAYSAFESILGDGGFVTAPLHSIWSGTTSGERRRGG